MQQLVPDGQCVLLVGISSCLTKDGFFEIHGRSIDRSNLSLSTNGLLRLCCRITEYGIPENLKLYLCL
jgi:hypothetical protein